MATTKQLGDFCQQKLTNKTLSHLPPSSSKLLPTKVWYVEDEVFLSLLLGLRNKNTSLRHYSLPIPIKKVLSQFSQFFWVLIEVNDKTTFFLDLFLETLSSGSNIHFCQHCHKNLVSKYYRVYRQVFVGVTKNRIGVQSLMVMPSKLWRFEWSERGI